MLNALKSHRIREEGGQREKQRINTEKRVHELPESETRERHKFDFKQTLKNWRYFLNETEDLKIIWRGVSMREARLQLQL